MLSPSLLSTEQSQFTVHLSSRSFPRGLREWGFREKTSDPIPEGKGLGVVPKVHKKRWYGTTLEEQK